MGFLAKLMESHNDGGTDYNKFTLLSDDESNDATIADYIVEQGTEGIWKYRKWASGLAECWGQSGNLSKTFNRGLGSGFYADKYSTSYPSGVFVGTPIPNVTLYDGGAVIGWASVATNNTSTIEVYPASLINVTKTIQLHFDVKGRWK